VDSTCKSETVLGPLIAVGRTSKIFRHGNDAVAKVLDPQWPDHWIAVEASLTQSVRALGVPAPKVLDVTVVDGRPAILFEYIAGPSLWHQMSTDRSSIPSLVRELAEMQRLIHSIGVPDGLPGMVSRRCDKLATLEAVSEDERDLAIDMTNALPRGGALLHGDFHPGNVLVGESSLVVIDWFDAAVGHPIADIARTELLLDAHDVTDRQHLPGATDADLDALSAAYGFEMVDGIDAPDGCLDRWRAITALSRLTERTDDDVELLVARWNDARRRRPVIADA